MKFEDIETGQIFNLDNTASYPKLKTENGYIDMRDEIVNNNPNPAVLNAKIQIMTVEDIAEKFGESKDEINKWVDELKRKYF